MAPMIDPIRPVVENSLKLRLVKRTANNPPTKLPTIPSNIVGRNPIASRPGTSARAMNPAIRPTTKNQMIAMSLPFLWMAKSKINATHTACRPNASDGG